MQSLLDLVRETGMSAVQEQRARPVPVDGFQLRIKCRIVMNSVELEKTNPISADSLTLCHINDRLGSLRRGRAGNRLRRQVIRIDRCGESFKKSPSHGSGLAVRCKDIG